MNKTRARELSETISNEAISDMLLKAKTEVKDWEKPAKANPLFSRGKFWNMFKCGEFDVNKSYHSILKYRFIEEFGEFLPEKYQPIKKEKRAVVTYHEDPKF